MPECDIIALTKMDVLSSMKEIPVITGYKQDGVIVMDFDPMEELESYTPVIEMLPGWVAIFPAAGLMMSFRRRPNPTSVFWNSF